MVPALKCSYAELALSILIVIEEHQTKLEDEEVAVHTMSFKNNKIEILIDICQ